MLAIVVWLLFLARARVIEALANPQAQADWQQWKAEVIQQQADPKSPIRRHPPQSDQPPGLILMRDYFGIVVAMSVAIATLLFGFLGLVLRGMWQSSASARHDSSTP